MSKSIFSLSGKYNTIAVIVVAALLLIILIVSFMLRPAWGRLQELGTEIPVEQQKRDQAKQDYENLQGAKEFFEQDAGSVEEINTALPIEAEVPSILTVLEGLAVDSGVVLTGFTPQQLGASEGAAEQQGAPAGVDSIEITANFSGRYPSLINFLYSLERSLRIVDVRVINVNAIDNSGADPVIDGNITFVAYYKTVEGGPQPSQEDPAAAPGSQGAPPAANNQPTGGGT